MKNQVNSKKRSQVPYIIAPIFLIIVSIIAIAALIGFHTNFSSDKEFYLAGEKVDGVVTAYTRNTGEGTVKHFVVILIVEYQSEDGTTYKLYQRATEFNKIQEEEIVAQEVGKTRPMIIDGKGRCITGLYDDSYYTNGMAICIVIIVLGSVILVVNLFWLCKSIKKVVLNKKD